MKTCSTKRFAVLLALSLPMLAPLSSNAAAQQVFTQQQIVRKLQLAPGEGVDEPQPRLKRGTVVMKPTPQPDEDGGAVVMRRAPQPEQNTLKSMRAPQPQREIIVEEFRAPEPKKKVARNRAPEPDTKTAKSRAPEPQPKTAKSRPPKPAQQQIATNQDDAPQNAVRGIDIRETEATQTAEAYRDRGRIDLEILFEYDSDRIDPKSVKQLILLGDALNDPALGAGRFMIAGHTDAAGGDGYNADLSLRRAKAVSQFLVDFAGVANERLHIEGYGEELLKYPDAPESGQNRRVEIINLGDAG